MKTILTQATIANLKPGPTAYDLADQQQRGLTLRVRPSGSHSWLVRIGSRWYTIGPADVIPPVKARKLAATKLGDAASGVDVFAEKAKRKRTAATLADFLDKTYSAYQTANYKGGAATCAKIRAAFPDFLDKPLNEITAFGIERWRNARHQDGIRPSTTNRELASLSGVLSYAVKPCRVLTTNPLRDVKRAKLDVLGRVRFLSDDEDVRLRAALRDRDAEMRAARARFNAWRTERGFATLPDLPSPFADYLEAMIVVARGTGARRGELFDLTWGDVDLVAARLTVRGATAKTGLSRRMPLGAEALAALQAWHDQTPEPSRTPTALVFPSPATGDRFDNINKAWRNLMAAAKIDGLRWHDLRHDYASRLVRSGVSLYLVQRLLGHATPTMTSRYAHVSDDALVAAVAKLAG